MVIVFWESILFAAVLRVMVIVPVEPAIFGPIFVSGSHGIGLSQETLLLDVEKDLDTRRVQGERRGPREQ